MSKPKYGDWLASINENPQSFIQFTRSHHNEPSPQKNTIYIMPLTFYEDPVPEAVQTAMTEFAAISSA